MAITKTFGKLVVALAVTVGCIGKFIPHLFFRLPNGFILWAMTGNPMPPYIIPGPFEEGNTDWLKEGDVIVTPAAKSGTTWMLFCSHQIRVRGNDEKYPYVDVSLNTPWPELIQTPGDSWETQREKFNTTILADGTKLKNYWDHPDYPFRVFKSHDHAEMFGSLIGSKNPPKKVKFLAMARPALDQIASMVPFFESHSEDFKKLWGGFPPSTGGTYRELAVERLEQSKPGGIWWEQTLPYVRSWWKVKDEDNVLFLHYADAVKDLDGTVKKMADFYGVKLSPKEHAKVVDRCSYKYMKSKEHLFEYQMPLNRAFDGKTIMKGGTMIRKGKNDDGKNIFTDEEIAEYAKIEEDFYGDDTEILEWHRNGSMK